MELVHGHPLFTSQRALRSGRMSPDTRKPDDGASGRCDNGVEPTRGFCMHQRPPRQGWLERIDT